MQLRQFLWIFLRCAHVTVNGMNRNVRTVCSILWNCYDFFFLVTVVLVQYNKNEKLRESLEELLKMFRDGVSDEDL